MRSGVIEQIGMPLEVYDKPADLFVAEFIGSPSMNLIHGVVTQNGQQPAMRTAAGNIVTLPARDRLSVGQRVVFGIRPEHLQIAESDGIQTTVSVIEPTGPEIHVFCQFEERDLCAITGERRMLKPGQPLAVRPDLERAHVFDADTGRAL